MCCPSHESPDESHVLGGRSDVGVILTQDLVVGSDPKVALTKMRSDLSDEYSHARSGLTSTW